jgi:hypothetical protein
MKFLVAVEKYKTNILKIVILFTSVTVYFSTFGRFIYSSSQNQLVVTIDIYALYI